MSWWIMNLIQVGFDCLSDLDTNVKYGYECHDGFGIWYRLECWKGWSWLWSRAARIPVRLMTPREKDISRIDEINNQNQPVSNW